MANLNINWNQPAVYCIHPVLLVLMEPKIIRSWPQVSFINKTGRLLDRKWQGSCVKGRSDGELTPCLKKKERIKSLDSAKYVSLGGSYATAICVTQYLYISSIHFAPASDAFSRLMRHWHFLVTFWVLRTGCFLLFYMLVHLAFGPVERQNF